MIIERQRKYLDGRLRLQVEEGWAARKCSALAEAPHESSLRVALHAARVDTVVIGCRAIAIESQMDPICGHRSVPMCNGRRGPHNKSAKPRRPLSVHRLQVRMLPIGFD